MAFNLKGTKKAAGAVAPSAAPKSFKSLEASISNCCGAPFTPPGYPDSDTCSACGEHAVPDEPITEAKKKAKKFDKAAFFKNKKKKGDKKEVLKETLALEKFIGCILEKKYAEGNKYLQAAVDSKLRERVLLSSKEKQF